MGCRFRKSPDVRGFMAEMDIHFPGREYLDKSEWLLKNSFAEK
jgi:hypothetical protein